jgi:hypothetical protein
MRSPEDVPCNNGTRTAKRLERFHFVAPENHARAALPRARGEFDPIRLTPYMFRTVLK